MAESMHRWERRVKHSKQHGYMVGVLQWSTRGTLAKGTSKESWAAAFADADRRAKEGTGK